MWIGMPVCVFAMPLVSELSISAMLTCSSNPRQMFFPRKMHTYMYFFDRNSIFVEVFKRLQSDMVPLCGAILDVVFSHTKFWELSIFKRIHAVGFSHAVSRAERLTWSLWFQCGSTVGCVHRQSVGCLESAERHFGWNIVKIWWILKFEFFLKFL